MADLCALLNCDDIIPAPTTADCPKIDMGRNAVRVFLGKTGTPAFSNLTDLQTLSVWQTRLADTSTGDTAARLVSIGTIYDGVIPEPEEETEQNPYGGARVVERRRTMTGYLKDLDPDGQDELDNINCRTFYTVWICTNRDYVIGELSGLQLANVTIGSVEIVGQGNGSNRRKITISWIDVPGTNNMYQVVGLSKETNP